MDYNRQVESPVKNHVLPKNTVRNKPIYGNQALQRGQLCLCHRSPQPALTNISSLNYWYPIITRVLAPEFSLSTYHIQALECMNINSGNNSSYHKEPCTPQSQDRMMEKRRIYLR